MVHIAGKNIRFDIDPYPFFVASEEGFAHGYRDNGEAERIFCHFIDREAHPVNCNGTFRRDKGDKFGIDRDEDLKAVAVIGDRDDGADRIDMPLDNVPFEPLTHHHGRFDMDLPFELFGGDVFLGLR